MLEKIIDFLIDGMFNNILNTMSLSAQLIVFTALGLVGVFAWRRFILTNIFGVFFPDLLKKLAKSTGYKINKYFEEKKKKGEHKDLWEKSESALIECSKIFKDELIKG